MKIKDLIVGDKVEYTKHYPTTCHERFPTIYDMSVGITDKRYSEPIPSSSCNHLTGFIIGIKMAIMGNFSYTKSSTTQGFEDPYPDTVPAYSRGKKELVLVVVQGIKGKQNKPVYVRVCDVTSIIRDNPQQNILGSNPTKYLLTR